MEAVVSPYMVVCLKVCNRIVGRAQGLRNNVLGGYVPVITEIVILPLPLSLSPR